MIANVGFSINDEASLSSGKISIGGAIIGSAISGPVGGVLGGLQKKGKNNKISWIVRFLYESKEGESEKRIKFHNIHSWYPR